MSLSLVPMALVAVLGAARGPAPTAIAVLPVGKDPTAAALPAVIDEVVLAAAQSAGNFRVIGQSDINALLGLEKQKDLLGCAEQSGCMTEIGGALGVDKLMSVSVSRAGKDWVVTAKLINVQTTEVDNRLVDFIGGDVDQLLKALPVVVKRLLTGTKSELAFGGGVQISVPRIVVGEIGVSGLGEINLEAERALERALDQMESPGASPEDKARAWCALAELKGNNPYQAKGVEGCHAWRSYADSLRRLTEALAKDYETLIGYLALKRKSAEQKTAAVDAFLAAYSTARDDARVRTVEQVRAKVAQGEAVELVLDDDGDGVPNSVDQCPTARGPERNAGCAETDADGDGILDRQDNCPDEAEDRDGFADEDGCPDRDNDGDGIADGEDACPDRAEDGRAGGPPDGCPGGAMEVAIFGGQADGMYMTVSAAVPMGTGTDGTTMIGVGMAMPVDALFFDLDFRFGTEARVDADGDESTPLEMYMSTGLWLLSFPRADGNVFSPVNLAVGGFLAIADDEFFGGLTVVNHVRLGCQFALGLRYNQPLVQAEALEVPASLSVELGLNLTGDGCW